MKKFLLRAELYSYSRVLRECYYVLTDDHKASIRKEIARIQTELN